MLVRQIGTTASYGLTFPSSRSFRFLVCIVFGLVAPYALWTIWIETSWSNELLRVSLANSLIANIACWYALERLREYAKARQLSYVVPVNLLMFGGLFTLIGIMRLPYSITLIGSCFVGTLFASYLVTALSRRTTNLNFVARGGRAEELLVRPLFAPIPSLDEFQSLVESRNSNFAIVADLHHEHPPEWERMFAQAALRGIPVYHYRQILEGQTGQVRIDHLRENDLGSLIPNLPYVAAKRVLDVVSVLVLSPLLLLVGAAIAVAVKLSSPGSILFFQERMGFRGQTFKMVKFRTMKEVDSAADGEGAARTRSMTER